MKKTPHIPVEFMGTAAVGERGQVVIPKEVRDRLGIEAGTKMVVALFEGEKLMMMPAERMRGLIAAMNDHFAKVVKALDI
jgi:AbrB family looped-hinge helix DNA binding protein